MSNLLLTYYGDDLTGSTDVMESLQFGGVPTVLFLEPPTPEELARFPQARAVGVAGVSRSMSPAQMDAELYPKFRALKALGAPIFHYKICSTFDSSPTVGSIGHAIDIGWDVFQPPVVPLLVGSPALRRYVVFGNLFARVGDVTHRLDRHPTMSRHPITPMNESDLRLHLGKQTARSIGLIDVWHMEADDAAIDARFQKLKDDGCQVILFDTLDTGHLAHAGRILWAQRGEQPVYVVGSSGVENALIMHWQGQGIVAEPAPFTPPGRVEPLIVVSGSASPPNAEQIEYSIANGFADIRLDAPALVDPLTAEAERARAASVALEALRQGQSVLLYSTCGPDDPAITATRTRMERLGLDPVAVGERLGAQQGIILRDLLEQTGIRRACVAGGDTCGYSARQLGIFALQVVVPIAPGAPLCRASSHDAAFEGLQIALKGGQNGAADYFVKIREGG
jgi:3-oxoisoapionate kinase